MLHSQKTYLFIFSFVQVADTLLWISVVEVLKEIWGVTFYFCRFVRDVVASH